VARAFSFSVLQKSRLSSWLMARTPMIENMWDEYLELNGFLTEREKNLPSTHVKL